MSSSPSHYYNKPLRFSCFSLLLLLGLLLSTSISPVFIILDWGVLADSSLNRLSWLLILSFFICEVQYIALDRGDSLNPLWISVIPALSWFMGDFPSFGRLHEDVGVMGRFLSDAMRLFRQS